MDEWEEKGRGRYWSKGRGMNEGRKGGVMDEWRE